MNCRPGDLAIIISAPLIGRMVDVLCAPPVGQDFLLPDDYPHNAVDGAGSWICRVLGESLAAPVERADGMKGQRQTRYAVIGDHHLRPIRPAAEPARDRVADEAPA